MKRTDNKVGTIALLMLALLLTNLGYSTAIAQDSPLKNGKMIVEGATYKVTISGEYKNIYINNYSADSITRTLINPKLGTTSISEDFIFVNTDKILEIKRRFYPQNVRADIRVILTKEGKLIGVEYILPKSPMITEQQFRDLDAEVRRHLKVSVVFPTEWVKNQEYDGYATKYLKLE